MPRPQKPLPLSIRPGAHPPELLDLASQRHAINVIVTEFDWLRASHEAHFRDFDSVSDVVRNALREYLEGSKFRERTEDEAMRDLDHELGRKKRREEGISAGNERPRPR